MAFIYEKVRLLKVTIWFLPWTSLWYSSYIGFCNLLCHKQTIRFSKFKRFLILLFSSFFILITSFSFADTIYLKNGRKIEGIVEKREGDKVVVNVGFGRITLMDTEIDHIEKKTEEDKRQLEEKWRKRYFLRPEYVPSNLKRFADEFLALERMRDTAVNSRYRKKIIMQKIKSLNKKLERMVKESLTLQKKLSDSNIGSDFTEYNKVVNKLNKIVFDMKLEENKINKYRKEWEKLDKDISQYTHNLRLFINKLNRYSPTTPEENSFMEALKEQLSAFRKDLIPHNISYTKRASSILVDAIINDKVMVSLVVDTGATLVVITSSVAKRLGIDIDSITSRIQVILANGSKAQAYPVILKSVEVEGARIENVAAAILDNQNLIGDGLLGMSFLENFIINIDSKNNKLILEEFNPNRN